MKTIWQLQEGDTIYCASVELELFEYKTKQPRLYQQFFVRMEQLAQYEGQNSNYEKASSWYTEIKPQEIAKDETLLLREQEALWSNHSRVGWFFFLTETDRNKFLETRKQELG